ncbi:hypothetical protein GCM10023238_28370 [Streptomyces heliomycini]
MAVEILVNSKASGSRGVCNAAETLLVHQTSPPSSCRRALDALADAG